MNHNKKFAVSSWVVFTLVTVALALIVYWYIKDVITEFIVLNLQTAQIIAGICAAAAVGFVTWVRVTGRGDSKYYPPFFGYLVVFIFANLVIGQMLQFRKERYHNQALEAYYATVKILVENGYCGPKRTFVRDAGSPCGWQSEGFANGPTIAGGYDATVIGVTDPKVLKQVSQVYLNSFLDNPEMSHVVVHFDSRTGREETENAVIEMRR